jgi:membrane associated rhomboid family serine protease
MRSSLFPGRVYTVKRRIPLVTVALSGVNAAVYLLGPRAQAQGGSAECARAVFEQRYGAVPLELTHNQASSVEPVASVAGRIVHCPMPEYDKNPAVSALTSMFVHASAAHLIGNLIVLLVAGWAVERRIGSIRFAALYLVCGYTAAYGFAFSAPNDTSPLIGASGAIAGVVAAHIWLRPRDPVVPLLAIPLLVPFHAPSWLVGQEGSNVAYAAHVVGLAVGLMLTALWVGRPTPQGAPVGRPPSIPARLS